jgi:GST-like protein
MIDVHTWPTPNGCKVTMKVEACDLTYRIVPVAIGGGAPFESAFLAISANDRMPAIVDHAPLGGGAPLSIFEYLADKPGMFLPRTGAGRYQVLQWVYRQMANLGTMMGNAEMRAAREAAAKAAR